MHIFTRCKDTTIFANACRKIDVFCTHCAFFVHIIKIRARVYRKINTIYVAKHRFFGRFANFNYHSVFFTFFVSEYLHI